MADQPVSPSAWVATSYSGGYLFKLVPAQGHFVDQKYVTTKEAFGVAYEINQKGDLVELWRTRGWFASQGWLSDDGRYFVRKGPWARDFEGRTDLALAFYDRGKLLKEYQVKDLIKDPGSLVQTSSHYFWSPEVQSKPDGLTATSFYLVMGDGTTYTFDISTGKILATGHDAGAKTMWELEEERRKAAAARGRELWVACPRREKFEKTFNVTDPSSDPHYKVSKTHFEGPEWRADFELREPLTHQVSVGAVLPVIDGKGLGLSITPEELLKALQQLVTHPLVQERFTGEVAQRATGLRVRITGDRLHWDTEELLELLKKSGKFPSAATDVAGVRPWCQVIIDEPDRGYTSLFFNSQTGEMIFPDPTFQGKPPRCFDASGLEK
ncbi:MAG: hypothetical protein ACAI34_00690 [Verrucomicrobium sp.]|nr:hypothetical protein [Verrucomicrobium sp.]